MKVSSIRLPRSESFPCTVKAMKATFGDDVLEWVSFGHPIRTFAFDSRAARTPKLTGPVVASATLDRDRRASLCIFPVLRVLFPKAAQEEFASVVLPRLAEWLQSKRSQPQTAVLGHEQLVVEWAGNRHRFHSLRFL